MSELRCPDCTTPYHEGDAFCSQCSRPLTAYADMRYSVPLEEKLARIQDLDVRPLGASVMAAAVGILILAGPLGMFVSLFRAHPKVREDAMNYAASAFSAVNVTLGAIVYIPLALAMAYLAFGVWAQRTWALNAGSILLGLVAVCAITGFWPAGALRWLVLLGVTGVAVVWFRPEVRKWYGQ